MNRRKFRETNAGRMSAPGTRPTHGATAVGPNRIGEQVQPAHLKEDRSVVDKSQPKTVAGHGFRGSRTGLQVVAETPIRLLSTKLPPKEIAEALLGALGLVVKAAAVEVA